MRMFSRGLLDLDMCASISYRGSTGSVNGLLNGFSSSQQNEIHRLLETCKSLASHPLLLPVIFVGMKRNLIGTAERNQWNKLGLIGNSIKQIGPRENNYNYSLVTSLHLRTAEEFQTITTDILGV